MSPSVVSSVETADVIEQKLEDQETAERSTTPDTVPPPSTSPKNRGTLSGIFSRHANSKQQENMESEPSGYATVTIEQSENFMKSSASVIRPPAGLSKTANEEESIGELTRQSLRTEALPAGSVKSPTRIKQVAPNGSMSSGEFGELRREDEQVMTVLSSDSTALDHLYSKSFDTFAGTVESVRTDSGVTMQATEEIEPAIIRRSKSNPPPSVDNENADRLLSPPGQFKYKRPRLAKLSKRVFSNREKKM